MTTDSKVTATQRPTTLTLFLEHLVAGTTCYSCDEESSSYNSMQVTTQPNPAQGHTDQLTYTLAKEIDDLNGISSQLGAVAGGTRPGNQHRLAVNLQQSNNNLKLIAAHSIRWPLEPSLCEGIIQ